MKLGDEAIGLSVVRIAILAGTCIFSSSSDGWSRLSESVDSLLLLLQYQDDVLSQGRSENPGTMKIALLSNPTSSLWAPPHSLG